MIKKVIVVSLILFTSILFCGFKSAKKPYLLISNAPISEITQIRSERAFGVRQRIYYALVAPDNFKYSGIRIQISKQDDKTSNWGFSIVSTEDIYIVKGDSEYKSYIVLSSPGHYIIQFFYLNNKRYPFVHREFVVR